MSASRNNNLLIIGAGQYGLVALEIALAMHRFGTIAFLDDSFSCHPGAEGDGIHAEERLFRPDSVIPGLTGNLPAIIGTTRDIEKFAGEFRYGFVAIGNPKARRRLTESLRYNCMTPAILVHPDAYVSPNAQLQMGCCVEPHATVQTGAVVVRSSIISSGAVVRHDAVVDEYCHVDCNAVVESTAIVPAMTKVASNTVFTKNQSAEFVWNGFEEARS